MTNYRNTPRLERPALTRRWPKPTDIQISGTQLLYRFKNPPQYTKWDFGFLREFIVLANLTEQEFPGAVEQYARTWGVLELCAAHDAPTCHPPALYPHSLADSSTGICPRRIAPAPYKLAGGKNVIALREPDFRSEPLSGWRFWSRQANTLLKAVAADNEGRELPREDWLRLAVKDPRYAPGLIQTLENHSTSLSDEDRQYDAFIKDQEKKLFLGTRFPWNGGDPLQLIAGFANDWLDIANVQLRAVVEKGRITMMQVPALESGWLFAAIATQLALIAASAPKLLLCSNCGGIYIPKNLPRTGTNTYCDRCGLAAAQRNASKNYRLNHGPALKARHLRKQGKSPAKIAAELGAELNVVLGWIEAAKQKQKARARK